MTDFSFYFSRTCGFYFRIIITIFFWGGGDSYMVTQQTECTQPKQATSRGFEPLKTHCPVLQCSLFLLMFHTGPDRTNHLRGDYEVEQTSTHCAERNEKHSCVRLPLRLPRAEVSPNCVTRCKLFPAPLHNFFFVFFAEATKKIIQQFEKEF